MRYRLRLMGLLYLLAITSACGAGGKWWGDYGYEAATGATAGGSAVTTQYGLHIGANGDCRLTVEGYQVSETIRCRADPAGDRLEVRFQSYADGSVTNVYDVQVYTHGEVLLVLSERDGELITRWKGLQPPGKNDDGGRTFVRQR